MLRILLVAPSVQGLHTSAEVRDLSALHRVTVLSEQVTARDVYQAARGGYDVIHFATHSDEYRVKLSDQESLMDHDLLQVARIAGAKCIVFNSCSAGRLAHYLIGHEVPLAVHTNRALQDEDAWKFPLGFYQAIDRLGNSKPEAYVRAFASANDGEGLYGLGIAPELALAWATGASNFAGMQRVKFSRRQWVVLAVATVIVIWLLLLSVWALAGMGVP